MSGKRGMRSNRPKAPPRDSRPDADFLALLDGRYGWVKAIKAREAQHISDLGGTDSLSAAQYSLARRAASIEAWITATEACVLGGDAINDKDLVKLWMYATTTLAAIYQRLGIKRQTKDVPTLDEYLKGKTDADDR